MSGYTAIEVRQWIVDVAYLYNNDVEKRKAELLKGLIVSTKVRNELLSSKEHQGKIVIFARVYPFKSENLGGGLWRVFIEL